ncbi:MAG: prepilin-type N-terminal cleavage/methylation domain-containing protein [Gemmatimonadaceae bacterium]
MRHTHSLSAVARRRSRRGFTLIELLIVVVIIGVLAAIAVPKFQNTKGKANLAALKSDLRNLATAEEAYFYQNGTYTSNLVALNLLPSPGVTFTFGSVTGGGWSAKVTHPQAYPIECGLFMGGVPAFSPAIVEGVINCQ